MTTANNPSAVAKETKRPKSPLTSPFFSMLLPANLRERNKNIIPSNILTYSTLLEWMRMQVPVADSTALHDLRQLANDIDWEFKLIKRELDDIEDMIVDREREEGGGRQGSWLDLDDDEEEEEDGGVGV